MSGATCNLGDPDPAGRTAAGTAGLGSHSSCAACTTRSTPARPAHDRQAAHGSSHQGAPPVPPPVRRHPAEQQQGAPSAARCTAGVRRRRRRQQQPYLESRGAPGQCQRPTDLGQRGSSRCMHDRRRMAAQISFRPAGTACIPSLALPFPSVADTPHGEHQTHVTRIPFAA